MDDSYPSPLKKQKTYTGELIKVREHDEQPYPQIPEFMLAGLSSENYEEEYGAWVNKQTDFDSQNFSLLARHYNLDVDAPEFYQQLALHLARHHVPAFRMKSSGKKKIWGEMELKLLVLRVHIQMKKNGATRSEAITALSAEGATYAPKKGWKSSSNGGLRNKVTAGEKLFNSSIFEKASIDSLLELEKKHVFLTNKCNEALDAWIDK